MNKFRKLSRFSVVLYWAVIIVLLGLFFTNDFGLVDIHKSSIITAVGIDYTENEMQVTAQIAVPQPSQSGDSVQYIEVQGSGLTVADALNEINAKTGFFPKLQFCRLILLGESCQKQNLFRVVGCFYRKDYSELTSQVAMCKGSAAEMLAMPTPATDTNSISVQRVLTEELKKSANVSSVNLKEIALKEYSKSDACFMPYVEANVQGTSEKGGGGDSVGGKSPEGGGQSGSGDSGGSGGSGGSSGGSGGSSGGGQSGQSGGQGGEEVEFTARKTAVFSNGTFAGILDEHQSFALNILLNEVRLAIIPCVSEDKSYTVGMKNISGGVELEVKDGVPELTLSVKAKAQIQGVTEVVNPNETSRDDKVPAPVLKAAEEAVTERLTELVKTCVDSDCDVLGAKELLYRDAYKYYDAFSGDLLQRMKVNYQVNIASVN